MTIIERIEALLDEGLDLKKIRAYLVIEDYSNKEIESAIKELGLTASRGAGFKACYFDWLGQSPRLESEATEYILGRGEFGDTSDSVKRNLRTNLNVWRLANRIWSAKGYKDTHESEFESSTEESAERDPELQEAWDKLTKAKAAWAKGKAPRKNSFHPDKVAKFNDDAIFKAYNDFHVEVNG